MNVIKTSITNKLNTGVAYHSLKLMLNGWTTFIIRLIRHPVGFSFV